MKIKKIRFCERGFLKISTILFFSMAVMGCSPHAALPVRKISALPLEVIHSGSGSIMSFHIFETRGRLYVTGKAKLVRSAFFAHIDVQLLDKGGKTLAEKQDSIAPRHSSVVHDRRSFYVASFPLETAARASKIRIIYHADLHK